MTWLSGWGKRIKLTLDSFRVDEDIADFPVLVTLASGTGKNSADVTNIFDELTVSGSACSNWSSDLTSSKTHYSNNGYGSPANMADNNLTTYCQQMTYVAVSSMNADITKFRLAVHNTTARTQLINDEPVFQGSNDSTNGSNGNWTTIMTINSSEVTTPGSYPGWVVDKEFTNGTSYGWYRLSGITNSVNNVYNEWEMSECQNYGSSYNGRKKIMITNSESVPCYTEIECWDDTNEQAWLWAKVPTIVSGTDTELYLYYDKTQNDNDYYVGDTGEEAACNVWNDNFVGVWHMAQDPSVGANCIKDSTSNSHHGTPAGSMTLSDLVDGKIGKGLDLDGSDDKITFPDMSSSFSEKASLEVVLKLDTNIPVADQAGFGVFGTDASFISHYPWTTGEIYLETFRDDRVNLGVVGLDKSNWHTLSVTNASGIDNWKFYQNITEYYSTTGEVLVSLPTNPNIGESASDRHLDGVVCELRISNTTLSPSWIKATYYSNWNNFITFGAEEEEPVYYLDGFVKEYNQPVSRVVKLYRRDTGILIDSDTSRSSDGYYYLTTPSSGTHFIIAFDDVAGEEFNALILDKVSIKGTV